MSIRLAPHQAGGRHFRRGSRNRGLRRGASFLMSLSLLTAILAVFPGAGPIDTAFAAGTQPGASAYRGNTIYAYTLAGEEVVTSGTPAGAIGTITSPTGAIHSGPGSYAATEDGVWIIELEPQGASGVDAYDWSVDVKAGGQVVPGRAWADVDVIRQDASASAPLVYLEYWVVNNTGYVYSVKLNGYNGINSTIRANAYGLTDEDCTPLYASVGYGAGDVNPLPGTPPTCGENYRIFSEEPAADLPASAPSASGQVTIFPEVLDPTDLEIDDLTFVPTSPTSAAGTFTYSIDSRFSGSYALEVGVDRNGSYDDEVDRTLLLTADGNGAYSYEFDGLDGNGDPIEDCTAMNARVYFEKLGEVHVVQADVEGRVGGIEITRLNGQDAPDSRILWNDAELSGTRSTQTPVLVGDGVDSTGGVHGWAYSVTGWGDDRDIDDWAYLPIEFATREIQLGGQCLEVEKTSDATEDTRVGDTVNYTVTATNTGDRDYTEDDPAHVFDDLTGVLDDADYNNDGAVSQAGDVSYDEPLLSWSGALPADESVELTYSVTLTTGGDREVKNVAFVGEPGDETPE